MAISKLLLYYAFTPLADPDAIRLWQRSLCEQLRLKGRIIVSPHGVNGTVGGEVEAVKRYVRQTREYEAFSRIDFSWADATGAEFPRLSVKVRDELVTFGVADQLTVDHRGVVGAGRRLTPEGLHELVETRGDEVVLFDGRNRFEAAIGQFRGAVVTDAETTRDFVGELESGRFDHLKNRPVVTYCTGGIRCEVLSSMMARRGFSEVYQLAGGIVRYGETFRDAGLWEGSVYVFDSRVAIDFSDRATVLGVCESCGTRTRDYRDCVALQCKGRALLCDECAAQPLCRGHRAVDRDRP